MITCWAKTYYISSNKPLLVWCAWLPDGKEWTASIIRNEFQYTTELIKKDTNGQVFTSANKIKTYCDDRFQKESIRETPWVELKIND